MGEGGRYLGCFCLANARCVSGPFLPPATGNASTGAESGGRDGEMLSELSETPLNTPRVQMTHFASFYPYDSDNGGLLLITCTSCVRWSKISDWKFWDGEWSGSPEGLN